MHPKYTSLRDRLAASLDTSGEHWLWTGSIGSHGYGQLHWQGKVITAHTAMYIVVYGPIPPKHDVCHTCDIRPCCHPAHLFAGTRLENIKDCIAKDRFITPERRSTYLRGVDHPMAKLTREQVDRIRSRYTSGTISITALAHEFGMSRTNTGDILRGKIWK